MYISEYHRFRRLYTLSQREMGNVDNFLVGINSFGRMDRLGRLSEGDTMGT